MNDAKLKLQMARLLPEKIEVFAAWYANGDAGFFWSGGTFPIMESEWLYVMQLVECGCTSQQFSDYCDTICNEFSDCFDPDVELIIGLTFNQRATAICKVKGIEV